MRVLFIIFCCCCYFVYHLHARQPIVVSAIMTLIVGLMYGLLCGDRQWMPRPDLNFISWGYGFIIIQGIIATAAGTRILQENYSQFRLLMPYIIVFAFVLFTLIDISVV